MCVCVSVCACVRTCVRACVRVCVRVRACVRACMCVCVCECPRVRACVRICVRACVRVCMYACVRVCARTCVCWWVCDTETPADSAHRHVPHPDVCEPRTLFRSAPTLHLPLQRQRLSRLSHLSRWRQPHRGRLRWKLGLVRVVVIRAESGGSSRTLSSFEERSASDV